MQLVLRDGKREVVVDLGVSTGPSELLRRLRLRGGGGSPQNEAAFQLAQDLRSRAESKRVFKQLASEMVRGVDSPTTD